MGIKGKTERKFQFKVANNTGMPRRIPREQCQTNYVLRDGKKGDIWMLTVIMCRCYSKLLFIETEPQPLNWHKYMHICRIYNAVPNLLPFSISHRIHWVNRTIGHQSVCVCVCVNVLVAFWVAKNKTTRITDGLYLYKSVLCALCGREHGSTAEQANFIFFITWFLHISPVV